jgi:ubiquitin carboxyl-terminal hydrolase 36/42
MDGLDKTLQRELGQKHITESKVDSQLKLTNYLTERIEFAPSCQEDTYLEKLREKYEPINVTKETMEQPTTIGDEPNTTINTTIDTTIDTTTTINTTTNTTTTIPTPHRVLYDPINLQLKWLKSNSIGSGLSNMGNTCFLNSVLQCLTYTPPLYNHLIAEDHKASCQVQGFCSMCELQRLVMRLTNPTTASIRPIPIIQNLKVFAKHLRFGKQEDAHEFLRYFIDSLQKACLHGYPSKLDVHSKHTTVIHQIFGGYHRSQVKCLVCNKTSNTFDPLLDINLDIKGCSSILQALSRSIKVDSLDGDNKYACPFCKKMTRATKHLTIETLPNVLTIQLKRFEYNSIFGGKISKVVTYPSALNMRPYMSETQGQDEWYQLYGVLVHFGFSCHSGHYYCYVKNSNNIWYSMNDSMVTQVSQNTATSQEAYLLFYVKDNNYTPPAKTKTSMSSFEGSKKQMNNVTKPTGVVSPSPKVIPPSPPPPPPLSPTNTFSTTTSKKPPPIKIQPFSHPASTVFTPRSVTTKSKSSTPQSTQLTPKDNTSNNTNSNISTTTSASNISSTATADSISHSSSTATASSIIRSSSTDNTTDSKSTNNNDSSSSSSTLNSVAIEKEKPHAYVQPIPHKPTARVLPSPQSKSIKSTDTAQDQPQTDSSDHWNVSDVSTITYGPALPPDIVQGSSNNWTVTSLGDKESPLVEDDEDKTNYHFNKSKGKKKNYKRREAVDSSDNDNDSNDEDKVDKDDESQSETHAKTSNEDKKRHRDRSSEEESRKRRKKSHHKKHKKHHSRHHHTSSDDDDSDIEVDRKGKSEQNHRKKHHEDVKEKKHTKEKRNVRGKKDKKKMKSKNVPEIKWDDNHSKRHHSKHLPNHEDSKLPTILDTIDKGLGKEGIVTII